MMLSFSEAALICRNTSKDDISFILEQEIKQSQFVGQWTREQHLVAISNNNMAHLVIEYEGQLEAFLILKGINDPYILELTRVVVSNPGNGHGRKILRAVKKFAFEEKGYNRLWLDVVNYNSRALGLYLSEGFVLEGTLREADFFNNQLISLHVLSILRREYK